uniref:RRM domain-containing protein n=1 Tax=Anabas testudineus TaxID=64144 RepID=A0A3Q1IX49_ANATE
MSHNYPYRRPTSDIDLRPEAGHYSSGDRRHMSPNPDFYRPPQESSSYPSSSSSRGSTSAQWAQDGALSILSSCGLEPSDLALLAELPEDVLTVESLPYVLKQIKGKRGTVTSFPPCTQSLSSSSTSYSRPPASSSGDWDQPRSQSNQCPLGRAAPGSLASEQDRWRNPRTSSSVRSDPTSLSASSSSSRYIVDFHHTSGPSEYGKTSRSAGPLSSKEHPSFSSAGQGTRSRSAGFSEPRSADYRSTHPPEVYHSKARGGRRESQTSSTRSSSRNTAATSMPSEKKALDFHGTCPTVFPYSCSLCDITVLSEKVWIKHINGTQHAEGQLSLLQQFPEWDCRVESLSSAKKQMEKGKAEEKPSHPTQTSSRNHKPMSNNKSEKKVPEKSKVVCVKFPPQSVDEVYLRKLTEPFGKIIKILMFPSLAFVELGSADQAKDLVKFHINYPPTVNGEQIEFSFSNTFNFLQSSQVVSFTPVPAGDDGQSDLISIVRRFGPPLYTLFLPSVAFVEMKSAADAQKLVDYYSSNTLRINNYCIKVSFSGEYKTLTRVPSAQRYEEEKVSTKRTKSSSREKEDEKTESKRRRSSSSSIKDREQERTTRSRSRDKSKEKSSRERKTRSRSRGKSKERSSREKKTRSRSRDKSKEKSSREKKTRSRSRGKSKEKSSREKKTRSRSRDKSKEKSSRERKTRSRSRGKSKEKSSREKKTRSRSRDKSKEKSSTEKKTRSRSRLLSRDEPSRQEDRSLEGEKPEPESRTKDEPAPQGEAAETQTEKKGELSADDSDIEGMEVIGEDGENVKEEEEDMDVPDNAEGEEQEEAAEENEHQAEKEDLPEQDREGEAGCEEEKLEGESGTNRETEAATETQQEGDEEELDFPVDLENCITLDELEDEQSDNQGEDFGAEAESPSTRVVYFKDLPLSSYTDAEFIKLVQDFGKAVSFLLDRENQEGLIEMSSSSEAQRAAKELSCKSVTLNGSKLIVNISHKYHRLSTGCEIQLDSDQEKTESRSSSEQQSKSKTSETCRKSEGKESSEAALKSSETESANKTKEKDTEDSDARKTPESDRKKEPVTKNTSETYIGKPDKDETEENNSATKSPKDSAALESPEEEHQEKLGSKETLTDEERSTEGCEGKSSEAQKLCYEEETSEATAKSLDQPDSGGNPPEQETENDYQLQDSVELEQGPGPAGSTTKPVGTEFVRPVVGYFCNLCELIYADEDEAKLQHCSSLMHYRKYKETTGKDPWSS